jgi:hypothetical protein
MHTIYLTIKQANAPTQQALRQLHEELPDELSVYSADEGGIQRIWVAYPQPYGEEQARTAVRDTLARFGVEDIKLAD